MWAKKYNDEYLDMSQGHSSLRDLQAALESHYPGNIIGVTTCRNPNYIEILFNSEPVDLSNADSEITNYSDAL